jgi:hypothetical protein
MSVADCGRSFHLAGFNARTVEVNPRAPVVPFWEMSPGEERWRLPRSPDHPPGAASAASEVEPAQNQAGGQVALD